MTPPKGSQPSSFCDSVLELIGKVRCRPVFADREREDVFRLRSESYRREGALPSDAPRLLSDHFDDEPNTTLFGFYIDGRLASSLRIHVLDRDTAADPALEVFPDHLLPLIEAGQTLVSCTRFVVDAASARLHPKLPYVTVRVGWMALEWFGADTSLATVRPEHQAFYKRLFGHRVVCPPRPYPPLLKPLSLLAMDYKVQRDRVERRYPFFVSAPSEREQLFNSSPGARAASASQRPMVA